MSRLHKQDAKLETKNIHEIGDHFSDYKKEIRRAYISADLKSDNREFISALDESGRVFVMD